VPPFALGYAVCRSVDPGPTPARSSGSHGCARLSLRRGVGQRAAPRAFVVGPNSREVST
jgi:hypothetical protein